MNFVQKKIPIAKLYFSDDVQLSSEAMGVYELQASQKFKSLNELIGLGGNWRCRTDIWSISLFCDYK